MPDPHASDAAPEPTDPAPGADLAYDPPPQLDDDRDGRGDRSPRRARRSVAFRVAAAAAVVLAIGAALLIYRAHHRRKVIAAGLSQADILLRLDTAAAYRKAASLLEPIAQLDPLQGGSVRAFALAMLFADYRQADAEAEVEGLLVAPGRAPAVPSYAHLAAGALSLGRKEAGSAITAASRAGEGPWRLAMQTRVALLAGNVEAALQPAASAAAAGSFPPGLALHGDVLRRLRKEPSAVRAAYEAALALSPVHPRAAYGLAKLSLAGQAPANEAEAALRRLIEDRDGTPANERARAGLHLAALRLRAGDPSGAGAALDAAGVAGTARPWALRAAAVAAEHRGAYRAVQGAPPDVQSASDDDPAELSPTPTPPPAAKAAPAKKAFASKKGAKTATAATKQASKKTAAAKKPATKKAPAPSKKPAAKQAPAKKPAATKADASRAP